MAYPFRHLIRFVALALLLAGPRFRLHAQAEPSALREVAIAFCTLNDSPLWPKLHVLPKTGAPVRLQLRDNQRSVPVRVTSPSASFVLGVPRVDPKTGKTIYVPVAEVPLPAGAARVLVMLAAVQSADQPVRASAFDDGLDAFPLHSVRVFNATGQALFGHIADFKGDVPAGISESHPYAVASDSPTRVGTFPIAFAIDHPQSGPRMLNNSAGEAWPYGRSLVILLSPRPGSSDMQLRVIVDAPPPPKPAK